MIIYIIINLYKQKIKDKLKRKFEDMHPSLQKLINNYISEISPKYAFEKEQEKIKLISLLSLVNFSELSNVTLKYHLKQDLLKSLQMNRKSQNLTKIKSVYVEKSFNFGNSVVLLNNLLYYCEILNISNIYLNSKKIWPIFANITKKTFNISLIHKKNLDFTDESVAVFDKKLVFFQNIIKQEIRIDKLGLEIKKNLPKFDINPNDLFIHIRSGDIFRYQSNRGMSYAQPPLCFYENILNSFKFRRIYIIAQDKLNPLINILTKKFKKIIFSINSLKEDIFILLNAYNIVASISSLLTTLIIINDNLKILWEYDLYRLPEKYLHLHHDIYNYKIKYSIYKMYPSKKYKNMMFPWRNTKYQRYLMIHEKCKNFKLFKY